MCRATTPMSPAKTNSMHTLSLSPNPTKARSLPVSNKTWSTTLLGASPTEWMRHGSFVVVVSLTDKHTEISSGLG